MANVYDTNVKLQAIADAITAGGSSDPALLAKLQAIADAITNGGGGGGSVTASNVSVVPTSPFVSTNLQNLSVEEANAITTNTGDITTINTALGNTSISGIGDGSVTGAISSIDGDVNTIETALGNTSISGVGDGTVTGAISTLNNSISSQEVAITTSLTPASVTIIPTDNFRTSAYVIRAGICFVNIVVTVPNAIGATSVAVCNLPTGLHNTYKPPSWSVYGAGSANLHAESLFQSGMLYISNATAASYALSFSYPVV